MNDYDFQGAFESLQLPADTLAALQEFRLDQDARAKQFEDLKLQADNKQSIEKLSMAAFTEDWNASQFWYTDDTAYQLAQEILRTADIDSCIACVSAPSVYIQIRNILSEEKSIVTPKVFLLEYDKRFEVFKEDFVPYDFQQPLKLPPELKGKCTHVILDPPFLSDDCQTKAALTIRYLASDWSPSFRFVTCTGERMGSRIAKLYSKLGVRTTTFEVKHGEGLSNEFRCYANSEGGIWKWAV
ncbi:hypothetical protein MBLNU230_g1301t1 [Neophaeotheca triangularis]